MLRWSEVATEREMSNTVRKLTQWCLLHTDFYLKFANISHHELLVAPDLIKYTDLGRTVLQWKLILVVLTTLILEVNLTPAI